MYPKSLPHSKFFVLTLLALSFCLPASAETAVFLKGAPKMSAKRVRLSDNMQILKQSRKLRAKQNTRSTVNEPEDLVDLAFTTLFCGESDSAIDLFTSIVEKDPAFVDAYGYRGFAYHQTGDIQQAIKDENLAIGLDPKWDLPHQVLSEAYFSTGELNKAAEEAKTAISLAPDNQQHLLERALISGAQENYKAATDDLSELIKKNPSHYAAFYYRALSYVPQDNLDAAKSDAEMTITLSDQGDSHMLLGFILLERGDDAAALVEFTKAVEQFTKSGDEEEKEMAQRYVDRLKNKKTES